MLLRRGRRIITVFRNENLEESVRRITQRVDFVAIDDPHHRQQKRLCVHFGQAVVPERVMDLSYIGRERQCMNERTANLNRSIR